MKELILIACYTVRIMIMRKYNNKGYVLLELLISIIIISIITYGFIVSYINVKKGIKKTEKDCNIARVISNVCNEIIYKIDNYQNRKYVYLDDIGMQMYEGTSNDYLEITITKEGHFYIATVRLYINKSLTPILLSGYETKEVCVKVYE